MSNGVQQYAVNDQIMHIYDGANNDVYVHIERACAYVSCTLDIECAY